MDSENGSVGFAHQLRHASQATRLLSSIAVGREHCWPPIQEVVRRQHENGAVLLFIGRAGKHPWSGSVQVSSETRLVEMARRIHEATTWLGGVYRVHPDAPFKTSDPKS